MDKMTDSRAAEAPALGGGDVVACQMSWRPKGMHEKVWTCRHCKTEVTRDGSSGHPFVRCTAPPSAPVGVEAKLHELADELWLAHEKEDDLKAGIAFGDASGRVRALAEALAQQPAADGGFTAADMMDARQEGREEAQQPAAVDGACGDACAHIANERDILKANTEALRAEVAESRRKRSDAESNLAACDSDLREFQQRAERLAEALRDAKELIEELTGDPNYERWDDLLNPTAAQEGKESFWPKLPGSGGPDWTGHD